MSVGKKHGSVFILLKAKSFLLPIIYVKNEYYNYKLICISILYLNCVHL